MHDVVVMAPGFCTPRIVMHMWLNEGEQMILKIRGMIHTWLP
jgi:hypothetical protein